MESHNKIDISVKRLRLGVVLLFLWWLPFWIVTPIIADVLGVAHSSHHNLMIKVIAIQTVIGIIGAGIAGKEVVEIIKHTPFKKVPKTVYIALRQGKILAA